MSASAPGAAQEVVFTWFEAGVDAGLLKKAARERDGARDERREVKVEVTATESEDPQRAI
jgi:hypothetical protein